MIRSISLVWKRQFFAAAAFTLTAFMSTFAAEQPAGLVLSSDRVEAVFSRDNGSLVRLAVKNRPMAIVTGGEFGLWQAAFADKTTATAADFSAASKEHSFHAETDEKTHGLRLIYQSDAIDVTVTVTCRDENIDFSASASPKKKTLLEFAIPARLRVTPDQVQRVVCPTNGNFASGMSLHGSFFLPHTQWLPHTVGGRGYKQLLSGGPVVRPNNDAPVPIHVTDEGRRWLTPATSAQTNAHAASVNRPSKPGQFDLSLIDSQHGPLLSAKQLGEGRVWRLAGEFQHDEHFAPRLLGDVLTRLIAGRPISRVKIGVALLRNGPAYGGYTNVNSFVWFEQLSQRLASEKISVVPLESVAQLSAAQAGGDFLAIINPYGEWLPVAKPGDMSAAVRRIEEYARNGGQWFETGGYSFFAELLPGEGYSKYETPYPDAFADFFHFQTTAGGAAVFRVQPRDWKPWDGVKNHHSIFVPGRIAFGGDARGGWCDRPYAVYLPPRESFTFPTVRIKIGCSVQECLWAYCDANGINRPLDKKMSPAVLDKMRRGVMIYCAGHCKELTDSLDLLPVPTLIHTAQYLHGGFDKQYPDHLPPLPSFGTPEEFRQLIDRAHKLGHLFMPYTNPTWWCDGPKGPTFERCGDAPLLKTLEGKTSPERYAANTGFTICQWHPDVQAANRLTRKLFIEQYPADVFFEDQCGARGWHYDANPASPTAYAYAEGMISMVDEDSQYVPLSTESGWDRVVNAESQLCGMTFELMPGSGRPLLKHLYDPATWEIFPLAQYIAHDKTSMIHHDLGQFVTDREKLSWTLGLGYMMSYRLDVKALRVPAIRQWLLWLDRLQKSVCSRYIGVPLDDFSHLWDSNLQTHENGVLRSCYGKLRILANLNSSPWREEGRFLAGYGFLITAPGLIAADLNSLAEHDFGAEGVSFVTETNGDHTDVWIYAEAGQPAAMLAPAPTPKPLTLTFDGGSKTRTEVHSDAHLFRLPERLPNGESPQKNVRYLWHAVAR